MRQALDTHLQHCAEPKQEEVYQYSVFLSITLPMIKKCIQANLNDAFNSKLGVLFSSKYVFCET